MKKTEKTVLTAALFAAALNIIPSGAINGMDSFATDYDPSTEEIQDVYGPAVDYPEGITTTTYNPGNAVEVPVYGPPVSWTTTAKSDSTSLTTTATTAETISTTTVEPQLVPLYGPPIAWTTTGTEMTTQTAITNTTTNTIPEAVYGPPIAWYGDVNADGKIDVFDMIELRKAYLNGKTGEGLDFLRADINHDGKIGMADLVMLNNYLLGKIDNFDDLLPEPVPTTAEPQYSYINTTTVTATEPVPQPEYGAPIAFN